VGPVFGFGLFLLVFSYIFFFVDGVLLCFFQLPIDVCLLLALVSAVAPLHAARLILHSPVLKFKGVGVQCLYYDFVS